MKNYLLVVSLFFVYTISVKGQCEIAEATITNGFKSNTSLSAGALDFDSSFDVKIASTFFKSLWLGGHTPDGLLKVAANTFVNSNNTDFHAGAIDMNTGVEILDYCSESRKIWKFKDSDILTLKSKFAQGNLFVTDLTPDLTSYPGRNNVWYELAMNFQLNQDLAPFFDNNNDGKYNPLDGDYPIALEENPEFLPKEFSFTVYDDIEAHFSSNGGAIGVEVHQTSYVCYEEGNSILNGTTYNRLKLINKWNTPIVDLRVALFIDDDLGAYHYDDFIGCDTSLATVYTYNGENGIDQVDGSKGVKLHLWLNRELESSMPMFGKGNIVSAVPDNDPEFYNYMHGKWLDGTPLTRGGFGFDTTSMDTTFFAFPQPPSDPNGWSMANVNVPGDRSFYYVSTIDEGLFAPGSVHIIDVADVALVDSTTTGFEKIDDLANIVAQVRDKYEIASTSSTSTPIKNTEELLLSPNPATTFISHSLPQNQSYIFDIFDMSGRQIDRQTLDGANTNISLHKLSQGIFVIKTRDKQGDVFVGKLVKI